MAELGTKTAHKGMRYWNTAVYNAVAQRMTIDEKERRNKNPPEAQHHIHIKNIALLTTTPRKE
jgi:hypothetical protein